MTAVTHTIIAYAIAIALILGYLVVTLIRLMRAKRKAQRSSQAS